MAASDPCTRCGASSRVGSDQRCPTCRLAAYRKPPLYHWTRDRDDQLKQAYTRSTNRRELSRELTRFATTWGWPRYILANRAQTLGLSLLRWKRWSPEELDRLRELVGENTVPAIARAMHRSPHSVKHQLFRLQISAQIAEGYSIRQLEQLLGVRHSAIQVWLSKRWLSLKEDRITESSVRSFLFKRMDAYSFRRCDELWLKGMLNPRYGESAIVRVSRQDQ